jgi:hypothetical protein
MKNKITFMKQKSARTGNILFQYLFCKLISLLFDYEYICCEEYDKNTTDFVINQENFNNIDDGNFKKLIKNKNIICDGFFQYDKYYVNYRNELLEIIYDAKNNDYWYDHKGRKKYIKEFVECKHEQNFEKNDIVVSLRLDDFMHHHSPTSNIIPPTYYLEILEKYKFNKLYIVCDTVKYNWEFKYLEFFQKFNPILIQEDLMHDCAMFRDCDFLLHSNSTLCWFMSYISKNKIKRYIPATKFYSNQKLETIEPEKDNFELIIPMNHHEANNLNIDNYLKNNIFPLSYCIPDEYVIDAENICEKKHIIADLIPGKIMTYRFGVNDESEYYKMYKESLFAFTHKKGGWDCMRHYEIMASGCIPIFEDLDKCPKDTLISFPKELIIEANKKLLPWKNEYSDEYKNYVEKMINHVKNNCTTSANAKYFLDKMQNISNKKIKNILLITCHSGVNYTRETLLIGIKRHIVEIGGLCYEHPTLDFLYKNYDKDKSKIHGNGYTYSMKLNEEYSINEKIIEKMIELKFFDIIIYGKVGPDELHGGSLETFKHWDKVFKTYSKNEIAFLYGGDECQDLNINNRYKQHLLKHANFGQCFVRELVK